MNIGELIERARAAKPTPPDDLLNGPYRLWGCGKPCEGHMPKDPARRSAA